MRFVGALLVGLAARPSVRSLYSLRSLELPAATVGEWRRRPLPAKTQGRTRAAAFNVSVFSARAAFYVIAHVRDWEHAETVRRRCLRTVRGFALHAE